MTTLVRGTGCTFPQDGGDILLKAGDMHIPMEMVKPTYDHVFMSAKGAEFLCLRRNGDVVVRGELAVTDLELVTKFFNWIRPAVLSLSHEPEPGKYCSWEPGRGSWGGKNGRIVFISTQDAERLVINDAGLYMGGVAAGPGDVLSVLREWLSDCVVPGTAGPELTT